MDSLSRGSESNGMASHVGEQVARTNSGGSFECNICLDLAQDPVVTLCGHLFCWPCLYEWFHVHAHSPECPVCKADVEEEKLVPIYGRGDDSTAPRAKSMVGVQIPSRPTGQRPSSMAGVQIPSRPTGQRPSTAPRARSMAGVEISNRPTGQRPSTAPRARSMAGVQILSRPTGQRPSTAQPPDHNHYPHQNPWFVGAGGAPVAGGRWGNYTFSAAIGGLFPLLNFQVHGFPQPTVYGMGLPRGFLTGMAILFMGSRVRRHRRDNRLIHT